MVPEFVVIFVKPSDFSLYIALIFTHFFLSSASVVAHATGVQVSRDEWQLHHQDLLVTPQQLQRRGVQTQGQIRRRIPGLRWWDISLILKKTTDLSLLGWWYFFEVRLKKNNLNYDAITFVCQIRADVNHLKYYFWSKDIVTLSTFLFCRPPPPIRKITAIGIKMPILWLIETPASLETLVFKWIDTKFVLKWVRGLDQAQICSTSLDFLLL